MNLEMTTSLRAWYRCRGLIFSIVLLAVASPAVTAQQAVAPTVGRADASTSRLVVAGIAGTVVGAAAGGAVGLLAYSSTCRGGPCEIGGFIALVGAAGGATLGAPIGVHVANDGRGRVALSLLASMAVAAGTGALLYALSNAVDSDAAVNASYAAAAVAAPALQIAISIRIERPTRR